MIKVAITGEIGSGKTTILQILKDKSYYTLSADEIVAVLYQKPEFQQKLEKLIGHKIKGEEVKGSVKEFLKKSENHIYKLEEIVHPYVRLIVNEELSRQNFGRFIFIEVPLLFEAEMENLFDKVILVKSSSERRRDRIKNRNGGIDILSLLEKRLLPLGLKEEKSHFIIENNGNKNQLEIELEKILKHLYD